MSSPQGLRRVGAAVFAAIIGLTSIAAANAGSSPVDVTSVAIPPIPSLGVDVSPVTAASSVPVSPATAPAVSVPMTPPPPAPPAPGSATIDGKPFLLFVDFTLAPFPTSAEPATVAPLGSSSAPVSVASPPAAVPLAAASDRGADPVGDKGGVRKPARRPSGGRGTPDGLVEVEVYGASIPEPGAIGDSTTTETVLVEERNDPWHAVRVCESGDNYAINTGNGFFGAYQFTVSTWNWVAGTIGRTDLVGVRPDRAAPADQDVIAQALAFEVPGGGLGHWPICGRRYGR